MPSGYWALLLRKQMFVGRALRTHLFYSRGQPGGLVTFLASPRKVTQRRRPHSAALRSATGSLRCSPSRAAAELGLSGLRQSSPTAPGLSALLGGRKGGAETKHPIPILAFPLKGKEPLPSLPSGESWREGREWRESNLYAHHPLPPLRRLGLVTYILGKQNKVTCRRAAPGT